MDFCAATVRSKLFCPAISEVKGRAPAIIAAWPVVDRLNYIINDVCITASRTGIRATGCQLSVPELSCERLIRRPAVGHFRTFANVNCPEVRRMVLDTSLGHKDRPTSWSQCVCSRSLIKPVRSEQDRLGVPPRAKLTRSNEWCLARDSLGTCAPPIWHGRTPTRAHRCGRSKIAMLDSRRTTCFLENVDRVT
jgi:hypothetical protein